MMNADSRLPVVLGDPACAGPDDYVVALPPPGGHAIGCACCGARDPLAAVLARAHLALVRGECPPFARIVVAGPVAAASRVTAVLSRDPVAQARFRDAGVLQTGLLQSGS